MEPVLDRDLPVEHEDVFHVTQLTRNTPLEDVVAADLVDMRPGERSGVHRHNEAETVLYFLSGRAQVILDGDPVDVVEGDRLRVGKGVFHGVNSVTAVRFLSVQTPPILDTRTGRLDFERLTPAE